MLIPRCHLRQYYAAAIASLSAMMTGAAMGWPSPVLEHFCEGAHCEVRMTAGEASWVLSLIEIGNLFSPIPCGYLVDMYGRQPCLFATGPLFLGSWTLIICSRSVGYLYLARLVQGLGMGIVYTVTPMYISEIAGADVRGRLSILFVGLLNLGILLEYIVGPFVSYRTLGYISISVPILFIATSIWLPESPYFLLMNDKSKEAINALMWLRSDYSKDRIFEELTLIKDEVEQEKGTKTAAKNTFGDIFSSAANRKAFLIVQIAACADVLSGMTAILAYASVIFAAPHNTTMEAEDYPIMLGLIMLLAIFPAAYLVDMAGRRPLLIFSCLFSGLFELVAAFYFYAAMKLDCDVARLKWIPLLAICAFSVAYSMGLGSLVPTLMGECFPSQIRGPASSMTSITLCAISFLVIKFFQVVNEEIGLYFNFFIYGVSSIACSAVLWLVLPETKGKTLSEIQQDLKASCKPSKPSLPLYVNASVPKGVEAS
ncbi:facilitated trehalose transporter Tret1 [Bemisia tabaci]|uniref:facilitated trehalose transporter Tret1 n=1 Tax=Bemisia tabaci TaxID=7038 RepID=UPI0008F9CAA8|nr:PREDICTED: facilitated trehalose transporter Tret1-like [Bemisia tabaci]